MRASEGDKSTDGSSRRLKGQSWPNVFITAPEKISLRLLLLQPPAQRTESRWVGRAPALHPASQTAMVHPKAHAPGCWTASIGLTPLKTEHANRHGLYFTQRGC